jgi:cytochrome c553
MRQFSIIAALAVLAALAGAQLGAASPVPPFFPASAERGGTLSAPCLVCHGPANVPLGSPAIHPPKLIGQRPDAIYLALLAYQRGTRTSPIMGPIASALSLQDLRDLGAYLAAEGPDKPPIAVDIDSWAHEKVHRDCTGCHGESGMGEMWGIPVITGQNRDYLVYALNGYRDGTRRNATMGPIASRLTPQEIEQLADYFSDQKHLRLTR